MGRLFRLRFCCYYGQKLEVHGQEENSTIDTFKEIQFPQPAVEPVMMMMMMMSTKYQKSEKMKLNDKRFHYVLSFPEEIISVL